MAEAEINQLHHQQHQGDFPSRVHQSAMPLACCLNKEKLEWNVCVSDIGQQQHLDKLFKMFYGLIGSWIVYLISVLYMEYRTRKEKENV